MRLMIRDIALAGREPEHGLLKYMGARHDVYVDMIEERLGQVPYLAGNELTAADIMIFYSLTTNRGFRPLDFTGRNNILAYMQRIAQRDGYRRSREKGDPNTPPLITAMPERFKYGG